MKWTMLLALLVAMPALAGAPKKTSALQALAAMHLGRKATEIQVLASSAGLKDEPGGAVLVRVADGADGGNPTCHILQLEHVPTSPGKVLGGVQLPVCARYDKDAKAGKLDRIELGKRKAAWRLRVDSQRVDTMAKGVEVQAYWAMATDLGDGQGLRLVFERTSTTFRSQTQPEMNQAELCEAPVVQGSDEPEGATIVCDTETMLDRRAKKQRSTFKYAWQGDRFVAQ